MKNLHITRCFKPPKFGRIKETSFHLFSDVSDSGYGQASYLRLVSETGRIDCCLLMGKEREAPIKYITIPRMELVTATLSVKILALLQNELQLLNVKETFWTDSKVVLGYIRNESRKFKVFVANGIELIRDHTGLHQWHYVGTKKNPADCSSRGIDVANDQAVRKWFRGPSFLWKPEAELTIQDKKGRILQNDPEIKKCLQINYISTGNDILEALESRISSWYKMKRVVAMLLRYKKLLKKCLKGESQGEMINSSLFKEAEIEIL